MPGPDTAKIGGNTSCVSVRVGDTKVIFDAGTGIRVLGNELKKKGPATVHVFFSHVHWDHIQGFPFFAPAFIPKNHIHLYGFAHSRGTIEHALAGQMENPNFPVKLEQMGSDMSFHTIADKQTIELAGDVRVTARDGHHPGGVLAYRVDHAGRSVVYATDTEHEESGLDTRLVELAENADIFIYDSMYTPEEYSGEHDGMSRKGWGHSTFVAGAEIAKAAGVKQYVLFHHDPEQSDADVEAKTVRAQKLFANSIAAREGLELVLE